MDQIITQTLVARPVGPGGFLVPQVGDAVTQTVSGVFGMPATIFGQVYQGRKGSALRVRVTGSAALIGSARAGATYALDAAWRVQGDPELQRRQDAREAAERAKREAREAERAREEAQRAAWAVEFGTLTTSTCKLGDVIKPPYSDDYHVVSEMSDDGGIYATYIEEPDEAAYGIGDPRGWRVVDVPLPDRPYIISGGRPGYDEDMKRWNGHAWVPVVWNDATEQYEPRALAEG